MMDTATKKQHLDRLFGEEAALRGVARRAVVQGLARSVREMVLAHLRYIFCVLKVGTALRRHGSAQRQPTRPQAMTKLRVQGL